MSTTTFNIYDHCFKEELSKRYALLDLSQLPKDRPIILDSYAPSVFLAKMKEPELITNTVHPDSVAISEVTAKLFNTRNIASINFMLNSINQSKEELQELYSIISAKEYNIAFVGYGGTGHNTLFWLNQIQSHLEKVSTPLFKSMLIFDNDELEFHNTFRFPKDTLFTPRPDMRKISSLTTETALSESYGVYQTRVDSDIAAQLDEANFIMYGAPDITTRLMLQPYKFISATHSNNDYSILIKPEQDILQTESYGTITVAPFFFNQLMMAIDFLRFLANPKWEQHEFITKEFNPSDLNIPLPII